MSFSPRIETLIEALRCLPGVGRKSAQRMALHFLERDRAGGKHLAEAITDAFAHVGSCAVCRNHSETPICGLCSNPSRDLAKLCVVETPADVLAIDQATGFRGGYFVLMGHLSPLDGIGPEQLGLPLLFSRIAGISELTESDLQLPDINEVIIATNPTVEGEATAHYIHDYVSKHGGEAITVSRIAHGVPMGGELEYVDGGTLAHAFAGRKQW